MDNSITVQPPTDLESAQKLGQDIEVLVSQIANHEFRLSGSYARLGAKLLQMEETKGWAALGFQKFPSYLGHIGVRIDRRRSQLYAIIAVAKSLLPYLTEEQLETIGIARAHELRRFVKQSGRDPNFVNYEVEGQTVRLLDVAMADKTTAAQLRVEVNRLLHTTESPKGTWYEMTGFYATAEERKELEAWWELGSRLIERKAEDPDHIWKKEVILLSAREVLGTYTDAQQVS